MKPAKLLVYAISIILVFLNACSPAQTPTSHAVNIATPSPTTTATATSSPTSTITPTPINAPTATQSPTPTATPLVRQSKVELVTDDATTGDGGNNWGGHQTRIVHTKDGVFTAYTVDGGGYLQREWRLAQRQSNGTWPVIASGVSGREPVNLLSAPDGTLHIIGWPNGQATLWSGKPEDGKLEMNTSTIPGQIQGDWPYNSAGIDPQGNLCVLSSEGGEQPGGRFYLSCLMADTDHWITSRIPIDYRFCYTYVFPGLEGQISLVSTRDVRWEALGYQKSLGRFDYVYNAIGIWHSDDIANSPPVRTFLLEEQPTERYPNPYLNAQQDAYIDTEGQIHVLYHLEGGSTKGISESRHAIISPSGEVIHDTRLPVGAGEFTRIFQDQDGDFYLLGSTGLLYPMERESYQLGNPVRLDFDGYQVEYSGFGVSVPRTGTPINNVVNIVFPAAGGEEWVYIQLDFSNR